MINIFIILAASIMLTLPGSKKPKSGTLRALESLPVSVDDLHESKRARSQRLEMISREIDSVSSDKIMRFLIVALGYHESAFSFKVGNGKKTGDGGLAFGYWQSWDKDRSGGVRGQVVRVESHLRRAGNYCKKRGFDRHIGAISLYATGKSCNWKEARRRVFLAQRLQEQYGY